MKFCPECGSDLNEDGICDYCTNRKAQDEENYEKQKSIKTIIDPTPRFGALSNLETERILESMKKNKYCPNCGRELDKHLECVCGWKVTEEEYNESIDRKEKQDKELIEKYGEIPNNYPKPDENANQFFDMNAMKKKLEDLGFVSKDDN